MLCCSSCPQCLRVKKHNLAQSHKGRKNTNYCLTAQRSLRDKLDAEHLGLAQLETQEDALAFVGNYGFALPGAVALDPTLQSHDPQGKAVTHAVGHKPAEVELDAGINTHPVSCPGPV